ncbi:subtilisin-like protein [Mycena belliarum]|uniref:tripeptidyl-peptidase II n=1 Tax=Mycena belliarum TaxID=1033014 RepID=A0AAD6XTN9_9AGAR|nr:subtilisin-like protein [Mycena belliae]
MRLSLFPLFLVFSYAAAVPGALAPRDHTMRVKESAAVTPYGWTRLGRAPPERSIRLRIALFQQDFAGLEAKLYEISDPDHPRYGAHMSKEEVERHVAPHPTSLALVDEWLVAHGIQESRLVRSPAKDWVSVTLPIQLAERILGANYYLWQHTSGDVLVRAASYSLPQYLHNTIELIQPTTMFARGKGMAPILYPEDSDPTPLVKLHSKPSSSCASRITLSCIKHLYNAVGYKPRATHKNAIGITGFLEEYANRRDLTSFYRQQLPAAVHSTFKSVSVYGGRNSQNLSAAGEEANLDTQFAFGIAYPTPGTFWSVAGSPPFDPDDRTPVNTNEPYLDWLDYILNSKNIPQTISTSYGDDEQTVPFTYASRVCKRFAELGCRGVSLLFASGDGAVGDGDPDPASKGCRTNDRTNTTRFIPAFPSSCPYVTSVGGTSGIPEVAANFSGGGFSDYFQRPAYQDRAVGRYLSRLPHKTYEGLFNRAGRGIPDVSAQARKFQIFWRGMPISIGGTSAAAPVFAGLVALLNDARLAEGRRPLGFLNPLFYKRGADALNDIVVGSNPGCGTPGFNATKGWDPVTGLGTPDFGALLEIVL